MSEEEEEEEEEGRLSGPPAVVVHRGATHAVPVRARLGHPALEACPRSLPAWRDLAAAGRWRRGASRTAFERARRPAGPAAARGGAREAKKEEEEEEEEEDHRYHR